MRTSLFAGVELVNARGERALGDAVIGNTIFALYFSVCVTLRRG